MNARPKKNRSSSARGGRGKGLERQMSVDGVYCNHRFMQTVGNVVGMRVQVQTHTKEMFEGILHTFGPDFQLVLDWPHPVAGDSSIVPNVEAVKRKMIFPAKDIVLIKVNGVDFDYATKDTFACDSTISRYNGQNSKGKTLEPWNDWESPSASFSLEDESSNGWNADDMFKENEERYGVKSTYSSGMEEYTTPLPAKKNTKEYKEQEALAQKLANEIEHNPASQHGAELENGDDEELRFSAVVRPDPPQSTGKYVLPQRRKIQGAPSGKPPPRGTPSPQGVSSNFGGSNMPSAQSTRHVPSSSPAAPAPTYGNCPPSSSSNTSASPMPPSSSIYGSSSQPQQHKQVASQHSLPSGTTGGPILDPNINGDTKDSRRMESSQQPSLREREGSHHKETNHHPEYSHSQTHSLPHQHYQHAGYNAPYHNAETRRPEPREQREQRESRRSRAHKEDQIAELKKFGKDFNMVDSIEKKPPQSHSQGQGFQHHHSPPHGGSSHHLGHHPQSSQDSLHTSNQGAPPLPQHGQSSHSHYQQSRGPSHGQPSQGASSASSGVPHSTQPQIPLTQQPQSMHSPGMPSKQQGAPTSQAQVHSQSATSQPMQPPHSYPPSGPMPPMHHQSHHHQKPSQPTRHGHSSSQGQVSSQSSAVTQHVPQPMQHASHPPQHTSLQSQHVAQSLPAQTTQHTPTQHTSQPPPQHSTQPQHAQQPPQHASQAGQSQSQPSQPTSQPPSQQPPQHTPQPPQYHSPPAPKPLIQSQSPHEGQHAVSPSSTNSAGPTITTTTATQPTTSQPSVSSSLDKPSTPEDKMGSIVSNSTLNPKAKEFLLNPDAEPFTPRSPSTVTPPRPQTPQIPPAQATQQIPPAPAAATGHPPFPQSMVQTYVIPSQQFPVQSQPRFQKRVSVGPQRQEFSSQMQVAAATGHPLLAPAPLTPITTPQPLTAVQIPQGMMQPGNPYYPMMMRLPSPFPIMVPTSLGMYHQTVDGQQNSQSHNPQALYMTTGGLPHPQPHHTPTPGPHPPQPPTPQGHNNHGPAPPPNLPAQPPTPGPTPPQPLMYGNPAGAPMGAQPTIHQHMPQPAPHTAQSPHNQYAGHSAAVAAATSHHPQIVMLPHNFPHMMPPGGPPSHSAAGGAPGHAVSSVSGYTPTSSGVVQHLNQSHVHFIPANPGNQGHHLPLVHHNQ